MPWVGLIAGVILLADSAAAQLWFRPDQLEVSSDCESKSVSQRIPGQVAYQSTCDTWQFVLGPYLWVRQGYQCGADVGRGNTRSWRIEQDQFLELRGTFDTVDDESWRADVTVLRQGALTLYLDQDDGHRAEAFVRGGRLTEAVPGAWSGERPTLDDSETNGGIKGPPPPKVSDVPFTHTATGAFGNMGSGGWHHFLLRWDWEAGCSSHTNEPFPYNLDPGGEAAVRMGRAESLNQFIAGEYPGHGSRDIAQDGFWVRVVLSADGSTPALPLDLAHERGLDPWRIPPSLLDDLETTQFRRQNWAFMDEDRDCRSTKAEVLIDRSRVPVTFADAERCRVDKGHWIDALTGQALTEASEVRVTTLVPVRVAYRSGGWAWTPERKRRYANDRDHLIITRKGVAIAKADRDLSGWFSAVRAARRCEYAEAWLQVKERWDLEISRDERRQAKMACAPPRRGLDPPDLEQEDCRLEPEHPGCR